MTDELDIPEFLRRTETPEEAEKRRKRMRREASASPRRRTVAGPPKGNFDSEGRALPAGMDAGSWAVLAEQEKAGKVVAKQDKAAAKERFRVLGAERAERAAFKRAAKASLARS